MSINPLRLASLSCAAPRLPLNASARAFSSSPISRFQQSTFKMGVTELTSTAEFNDQVKGAQGPVIVDYFATWCGPCKAISPILEKLSDEHTGIKFFKVDVDKLSDVAADNGISAMPTFQFYKGGEVLETVRGANPSGIQAGLQKLLAQ